MKYWDGYSWKDIDDEVGIDIPTGVAVLTCEYFPGTVLDPSIHVITSDESKAAVEAAHERFRRSRDETPAEGTIIEDTASDE